MMKGRREMEDLDETMHDLGKALLVLFVAFVVVILLVVGGLFS